MKQKREGQGTGHDSGTIMPKSPSWPRPRQLGVSGVRNEREQMVDLARANTRLGDLAKHLKEDRDEKETRIQRNKLRIRELETEKLVLENAARRGLGSRVKAAMSRLFGVGKRGRG